MRIVVNSVVIIMNSLLCFLLLLSNNNNNNKLRDRFSPPHTTTFILISSFTVVVPTVQRQKQQQGQPLFLNYHNKKHHHQQQQHTCLQLSITTTPSPDSNNTVSNINVISNISISTSTSTVGSPYQTTTDSVWNNDNINSNILEKSTNIADTTAFHEQQKQQQQQMAKAVVDSPAGTTETKSTSITTPNIVSSTSIGSILSASLLITSTTVGAGCIVLPEIAKPIGGMIPTILLFIVAYCINLVSSLIIAQIAIQQKNIIQIDSIVTNNNNMQQQVRVRVQQPLPSSFKEFTRTILHSDTAAIIVSGLSLFINTCVLSFNFGMIGTIVSSLISSTGSTVGLPLVAFNHPMIVSVVFSFLLILILGTQSLKQLSNVSNILVIGLFISFGAILVPGLLSINDPIGSLLLSTTSTSTTGTDLTSSIAYALPIIVMSTSYQNVIPTITKMLLYDRTSILITIIGGSLIPIILYLLWIFVCINDTSSIDLSSILQVLDTSTSTTTTTSSVLDTSVTTIPLNVNKVLLTIFSIVTICGSSICGCISMAEEIETYFSNNNNNNNKDTSSGSSSRNSSRIIQTKQLLSEKNQPAFLLSTSIISVLLPLFVTYLFATNDNTTTNSSTNNSFTTALAIAGSYGSPILYGIIPAYMAYQQIISIQKKNNNSSNNNNKSSLLQVPLSSSSSSKKQVQSQSQSPSNNTSNTIPIEINDVNYTTITTSQQTMIPIVATTTTTTTTDTTSSSSSSSSSSNLVPVATLPMFGALSSGYVGQELFQILEEQELFQFLEEISLSVLP